MLLLLDLDGVLVSDGDGDTQVGKEILRIHPELSATLQNLDFPIAILTHRSRKEAGQIVQALELDKVDLLDVFTANDIAFRRPTPARLLSLLRYGVRKSRIVPHIQACWKIDPDNIVFVDDRNENVVDMKEAGIGLGVHVPAARFHADSESVETFDLTKMLEEIQRWRNLPDRERRTKGLLSMASVQVPQKPEMFSGVVMNESGLLVFKRVRRIRRLFKRTRR